MADDFSLPVDAIRNFLNSDAEFKLAARFWDSDIRFVVGDEHYFMRIRDGVVAEFFLGTQGFDAYDINIGGPVEVWQRMVEPIPEPFYHDWFAASFHHQFEISGDLGAAYAYYYALRRMHAAIGAGVRQTAAAA